MAVNNVASLLLHHKTEGNGVWQTSRLPHTLLLVNVSHHIVLLTQIHQAPCHIAGFSFVSYAFNTSVLTNVTSSSLGGLGVYEKYPLMHSQVYSNTNPLLLSKGLRYSNLRNLSFLLNNY